MSETNLVQQIRLEASKHNCFLSRNNSGSLQDKNGRWVKFGLFNPGGADLIGIFNGKFIAVEVKLPHGRVRPEQEQFIRFIQENKGIAGICRSVEDFKNLLLTNG